MRVGGRGAIIYSLVAANGLCCWWGGGRRIWVLVAAAAISSSSSSSHCCFWRIIPLVHWRQMVSILLLLVLLTSPPWVKPMHLRAFFVRREMKDPWEVYLLLMIIVCGRFFFLRRGIALFQTRTARNPWRDVKLEWIRSWSMWVVGGWMSCFKSPCLEAVRHDFLAAKHFLIKQFVMLLCRRSVPLPNS